jgi:hypothetical protein
LYTSSSIFKTSWERGVAIFHIPWELFWTLEAEARADMYYENKSLEYG